VLHPSAKLVMKQAQTLQRSFQIGHSLVYTLETPLP
jgi:hypothetical protein